MDKVEVEDSVQERVARGVEWLDEHKPGWERIVNLMELELESSCKCVLGQVFEVESEAYCQGMSGFNYALIYNGLTAGGDWAYLHGFDMEYTDYMHYDHLSDEDHTDIVTQQYLDLRTEWERVIKARFDMGVLSDAR